jgi:hypothetical protein
MLKRFSHFFAYLLLVLMPLQALAAANMLVCNSIMRNSMMQAQPAKVNKVSVAADDMANMPCHKHISSKFSGSKHEQNAKSTCKTYCASVCANLCALTALNTQFKPSFIKAHSQAIDFNHQVYASITQASLQRPPIFFI